MTKRYTGGVVSSSLPTVNSAGASGVFLLSQQADYQSRNSWPPFKVEESLRFRSSASAYLNRTFTASNRRTFTFSAWVKRGPLTGNQNIFGPNTSTSGSGTYGVFRFVDGSIEFFDYTNGTHNAYFYTSSSQYTFRDPAAWYHLVLAVDTTQATGSNRIKVYVNGTQITGTFYTTPTQNVELQWNNNLTHYLGTAQIGGSNQYFDGYLAEVNFIDGLQLTPSSFGATDKDGNWSPIAYTGTYGTNGFYVNFRDNTSATTVGYDYSGNGNNWTLNGFNVSTANTSYDIMIDVPQDQSDGTANNRGSYCTWNPLNRRTSTHIKSTSNGNLSVSGDSDQTGLIYATIYPITGKWYFEFSPTNTYTNSYIGIGANNSEGQNQYPGNSTSSIGLEIGSGKVYKSSLQATYTGISGGEIGMIAWDCDTGKVWMGRQGAWFNSGNPAAGTGEVGTLTSGELGPMVTPYSSSGVISTTFGQRPFAYAPPSGFKALNTFNLPEPTIKQPNKYFDATIWTGDQTNKQIPLNFTADFVWAKRRDNSDNHVLYDAIRGVNNGLNSNTNSVEAINNYGLDFDNGNYLDINGSQYFGGGGGSGITFVAWNWNAGGANTTNTSGSITSIVRANPTAGFSVVTYTGTGSNATVGHGLGVAPQMILVKNRAAAGYSWLVYHKFMATSSPATWYMSLNQTSAASNGANVWIDDPTSTVFTVSGSYPEVNGSTNTYVAYCFAPIAGYSAFGSYVGNDSADGTFIYTGFRPAFVLYKKINGIDGWLIYDAKRNSYNVANALLQPDNSGAEAVSGPGSIDILSNGFKHRNANNIGNSSSFTYIYMAFAEMPFKYARAR